MTALADSRTMLRRNLRHAQRYTYGDALGAGIATALGTSGDYIQ